MSVFRKTTIKKHSETCASSGNISEFVILEISENIANLVNLRLLKAREVASIPASS